eukprot:TRINITY_DN4079_c0_g1_i2.p1 TRINITY_DN4079_c0_g1~~TRINITY_DN4079_c0_g1_i2.p1  ORF type:complete len:212 (-),score=82.61 TRINITY_DN4079_c0_g1_i2:151-786(-)
MITEVEAYVTGDGARRPTRFKSCRNGTLIIFSCHGSKMVNISCNLKGKQSVDGLDSEEKHIPQEVVLLRGILMEGKDPKTTNGPGKVAEALNINLFADKNSNIFDSECRISILPPEKPEMMEDNWKEENILTSARVGLVQTDPYWKNAKLRFYLKGFPVAKAQAVIEEERKERQERKEKREEIARERKERKEKKEKEKQEKEKAKAKAKAK